MLKDTRDSGIELLRIFAAAAVIFSHFCNVGGIFSGNLSEGSYLVMSLIRSLTVSAVDVFVLISGYFLCTTDKRTLKKPFELIAQLILYSLVIYLALSAFGVVEFSGKGLVRQFIPANWFVTLYVVLYVLSPYINAVTGRFSKKGWTVFFVVWLSLFSLIPMLLGIFESFGVPIADINPYGMMGNTAGYSLVNFVTLYCVGSYLRVRKVEERISLKAVLLTVFICVLLLWGLRFVPIHSAPWHIAGWYDNIVMILMAASLFVVFKKIHLKSVVVNRIAGASFAVFIIHCSLFSLIDPAEILKLPVPAALLRIAAFTVFVFVVAFVLSFVFRPLVRKALCFLDKYTIPYFDN